VEWTASAGGSELGVEIVFTCAVGTEKSEVTEEKISAGGRKGAEEASLAIADVKKISPCVRYAVSCEEEEKKMRPQECLPLR
jgi:hypothetical protein